MSDEERLEERARSVLADLHGVGVTQQTALDVILSALRWAWKDGQQDAWDASDPRDD